MKSDAIRIPSKLSFRHLGKRIFDIFFSFMALIVLSPLFPFIALGIYFSSRGKVIYSQPRLGQGEKVFNCYKFRSMHDGADEILKKILEADPLLNDEWKNSQKLKNDPRVFSFGKFLRKTSLDEVPQFWNVIKGELSVVGPRPYMTMQRSELGPHAYKILSVRPGITGLWQTSGRSNKSFSERIVLDSEYVATQSFRLDLLLIIKTLPALLPSKNAC